MIGVAGEGELKIDKSSRGDLIVTVGLPHFGHEGLLAKAKGEIADLSDLSTLLYSSQVHDVIPVGFKGIPYETNVIAKSSNLKVSFVEEAKVIFSGLLVPQRCSWRLSQKVISTGLGS